MAGAVAVLCVTLAAASVLATFLLALPRLKRGIHLRHLQATRVIHINTQAALALRCDGAVLSLSGVHCAALHATILPVTTSPVGTQSGNGPAQGAQGAGQRPDSLDRLRADLFAAAALLCRALLIPALSVYCWASGGALAYTAGFRASPCPILRRTG